MTNLRRRRRSSLYTLYDAVRLGKMSQIAPSVESGWKAYDAHGRSFLWAATNLVPDPQGVLADGTFWPATTAHTTATANSALPLAVPAALAVLTRCLALVNDGTADAPETANLTVSASLDYWTSIYVYAPTLGGNLTIKASVKSDAHLFTVAALTGTNTGWVRYTIKSSTVSAETTLKLQFIFAGGTASTVYVTGAQVVQELFCTPFFCGLSGFTGCVWSGTANASTSTRAASLLAYANSGFFSAATGTVATLIQTLYDYNDCNTRYVCGCFDSSLGVRLIWNTGGTAQYKLRLTDGTGTSLIQRSQSFAATFQHTLVARWSPTTLDLNLNSVDAAQVANARAPANPASFYVGSYSAGAEATGSIMYVLVSPERKSDAWVAAFQAETRSGYSWSTNLSPFYIYQKYMQQGDLLIPLSEDANAYLCTSALPPFR